MKSPARLAQLQLIRRKGRSLFLILTMGVSIGVSSALLRIVTQSRQGLDSIRPVADAVVGPKESSLDLLWESVTLQKSEDRVIPFHVFETIKTSQSTRFEDGTAAPDLHSPIVVPALLVQSDPVWFGTDQDFPKLNIGPVEGLWFQNGSEVVVGKSLAKRKNWQIGDTIQGPGGGYQISGLLESSSEPWSETVYVPILTLRNAALRAHLIPESIWKENVLDFFLIKNVPIEQKAGLQQLINERTVLQILWLQPEIEKLTRLTGQTASLFELIAGLVGLLTLLSVSGLLITEVQGMENQILTLKAIGYSGRQLAEWLLWEGLAVAGFALMLGILLDYLISPTLQNSVSGQLPIYRFQSLPLWSSFPLWLILLAGVPLSLMIPLFQILRKDISTALRK